MIKDTIPASARATWYAVASATVAALVAWGVVDEVLASAITGVAVAVVTLIFAIIHSDTPWRQALYGVAAAVVTLGALLGWGTEAQLGSLLMILASVLGISTAAATTDAGDA